MPQNASPLIVYATLAVILLFGLAGVLFIQPGPESTQRLGLLFGLLGTAVAAIVAAIRSEGAYRNTNGRLDARIEAGVHRAMAARRRGDEPLTPAQVDGIDPLTPEQARAQGQM